MHTNTWLTPPLRIDGIQNLPVGTVFTYSNGGQFRLVVSRNAQEDSTKLIGETQSYTSRTNADEKLCVYWIGDATVPQVLPAVELNTAKGKEEAEAAGYAADVNYLLQKARVISAKTLVEINVDHPPLLEPNAMESFNFDNYSIEVPKHTCQFKKWNGKPIYDFGGKPLINHDGKPVFAELATLRMGRKMPWDGRWVETYAMKSDSPYLFLDWTDNKLSEQTSTPIQSEYVMNQLQGIADKNGGYGGCWDIVFWKGSQVCFYECKRKGKDAIRGTQKQWLLSALELGFSPEQFVVLEWDFE